MQGKDFFRQSSKIIILVAIVSSLYTLFLFSPVINTFFNTPKGHVNMMVGHYFEDYYEYLSFVSQGQRGGFLIRNLFDNKDESLLFVSWWPYWLIGFISYLLRINILPTYLYWLSSGVFILVLFMLIFKVINYLLEDKPNSYKLAAFLFVLFSSSFFTISKNKGVTFGYFDFWYSMGSPFSRFNIGTPHHQVANIVFLLSLIFTIQQFKKKLALKSILGFSGFSLTLLILSPSFLLLYWTVFILSSFIYFILTHSVDFIWENRLRLIKVVSLFIFPLILTLLAAYFLKKFFMSSPTMLSVKEWDMWHLYYPSFPLFLLTTGPILIFVPAGLFIYFSKVTYPRLLLFLVAFLSLLFALVPFYVKGYNVLVFLGFHNLRFQVASSYIFLAVATVEVFGRLFRKPLFFWSAIFFLLLLFLPSILIGRQRMETGIYSAYSLQFIPKEIYQGLSVLERVKNDKVVLTSSHSMLGLVVPTISNKRVYLGRSIFTLNHKEKLEASSHFYSLEFDQNLAQQLLRKENIGYVILTRFDGDRKLFQNHYSFLKSFYQNDTLTIYQVD